MTTYPSPTAPAESLNRLVGKNVTGVWTLQVKDTVSGPFAIQAVDSWRLKLTVAAGEIRRAQTDLLGRFRITGLRAGTYKVTPLPDGDVFRPADRTVTVGPSASGLTFETLPAFAVRGRVTRNGVGVQGVSISVIDVTAPDLNIRDGTTNEQGYYTVHGVPRGQYRVTARRAGLTITPASREITLGPDAFNIDFTATSTAVTAKSER